MPYASFVHSPMQSGKPNPSSAAFLETARKRSILSDDEAITVQHLAESKSIGSSEAALQSGLLKPFEVEIVEAFTAPKDLAPGYELKDVLGHGALGVVYRAYQAQLQRDVAIKSIIESRVTLQNANARFQQEGTAIGRLKHPNIVGAYDSGCHRNRLYLVMELVEGEDLRRRLEQRQLSTETSLLIARQTAFGLAHAKSHEIIHRDIKPGNLILTDAPAGFDLPEGVPLVKIADFGLAQLDHPDENEDQTRLTVVGATMGTPMYSAPEQLTGDPIDHRVDIYALGATLFHMLTGQTPYESTRISKVISAKLSGASPRLELLKGLDPAVINLVMDLMRHDPDERPADYPQVIKRIDDILMPGVTPGYSSERILRSIQPAPQSTDSSGELGDYRKVFRLAVTLLIVAVLATTVLMNPNLLHSPPVPSFVPDGWEHPLFDGRRMPESFSVHEGLWQVTADAEGGSVLTGKGSIMVRLPNRAAAGYGFRVGIDLTSAPSAEVQFGFADENFDTCQRYSIRYEKEEVVLGFREGMTGRFTSLGTPKQYGSQSDGSPAYPQIRVEYQGNHWFVYFNGQLLGNASVDREDKNRLIMLVAEQGNVNFEGPAIYGLTLPKPVPE